MATSLPGQSYAYQAQIIQNPLYLVHKLSNLFDVYQRQVNEYSKGILGKELVKFRKKDVKVVAIMVKYISSYKRSMSEQVRLPYSRLPESNL